MPMGETTEDEFGFGAVASGAKERIKQIRPSIPSGSLIDMATVDALADKAGFISREIPQPEYGHRGAGPKGPEPRIPLNMRVPVGLGGAFQRFCRENRYSYPEALAEVMLRAGLPIK